MHGFGLWSSVFGLVVNYRVNNSGRRPKTKDHSSKIQNLFADFDCGGCADERAKIEFVGVRAFENFD